MCSPPYPILLSPTPQFLFLLVTTTLVVTTDDNAPWAEFSPFIYFFIPKPRSMFSKAGGPKYLIPHVSSCCLHCGGKSQSVSEMPLCSRMYHIKRLCGGTVSGSGVKEGLAKTSNHANPREVSEPKKESSIASGRTVSLKEK